MAADVVRVDASADPQVVLDERAQLLAQPLPQETDAASLYLVVEVGGHRLALPATTARHVATPQPITAVASPVAAIAGIVAIRGHIMAAVDLGTVLGVTPAIPVRERAVVVIDDGAEAIAALVDVVVGLESLDVSAADAADPLVGDITSSPSAGPRLLRVESLLESLAPRGAPPSETPPGGSP